jgi:hypothetical protein
VIGLIAAAACGGKAPPATEPEKQPTVVEGNADPAPAAAAVPFGRYAAVPPDGYTVQSQGDTIAFVREGITLLLADGADQTPPAKEKCLGYLEAFASGVLTGLEGDMEHAIGVDIVSSGAIDRGCHLEGVVAGATQLVEATILDLGNGGLALCFLAHLRSDDGAHDAFAAVVASIAATR